MTRTTVLALAVAVSAGSTALAADGFDSDNNPVPSAADQVSPSGWAWERSYGAPYRETVPSRRYRDRSYYGD